MASGRRIGEVFVAIEADTSMFRAGAIAGVRKAVAGINPEVRLGVNTNASVVAIQALKRRMTDLTAKLASVKITADGKTAEVEIRRIANRLTLLATKTADIQMTADTTKLDAEIARETLKLRKFQQAASKLKLDANDKDLLAKIANLDWRRQRLQDRLGRMNIATNPVGVHAVTKTIASIEAQMKVLDAQAQKIKMKADATAFKKEITESQARIKILQAEAADIKLGGNIDVGKLAAIEAETLTLEAVMSKLGTSVDNVSERLTRGRVSWFGWIGGLLSAKVALFAGAREVGGLHLALDSIVETLAILIPALAVLSLGLGAFAAAAFLGQDTLRRIAHHMQNLQVIADATGKKIPPLTNHFDQLARVIRPQVFQLLGDAIGGAGNAMGILDKLAIGTGKILDRFAAQVIVDMRAGGAGIKHFVETGTFDLKQLGVIFVNIGHVIARIGQIAAQTGIAEHLVQGLAVASHALSLFLDLPTPLLALVAALHGVYLWSGLATTALVKMALGPARGLAAMVGGIDLAKGAVRNLDKEAGGATRIKAYGKDIGAGFAAVPGRIKALGGALRTLFSSPWTWVAIGAAALIGFTIAMLRTKDATDSFIDSTHKAVAAANIFNVINVTATQVSATNKRMAATQRQANAELLAGRNNAEALHREYGKLAPTTGLLAGEHIRLAASSKELTGNLVTETTRLTQVSDRFGTKGLAGAMALAALAGVRVKQDLLGDPKAWAVALQEIQGLVDGYRSMGQGSGQLASDLNALTVAGSEQIKAMGQLNDAYDTFIKITSGPTTGFITFAEGLIRFSEDAKKAGARMTGFGGAVINTSKKVRSTSLQLRQDFQDTISSAEQMADAMRLTGVSAGRQVAAIKDVIQVLIPMAGTNKAAAAEISALAQEAGGPATTNLKVLSKWAGKTKDPLAAMDKAASDATVSFSELSVDAQKLGTALSQDLSKDMAIAVESAVGLQGAMNTFAHDIRDSGTSIAKTNTDRQKLIDDLAALGIKGPAADSVIKAIVGRLGDAKGPVSAAAVAFEKFAINGLRLSTVRADALWKKLNESNLLKTANDATTSRSKWIALAMDGLDLNRVQADKLWKKLREQYLTKLGTLTDLSKDKWIKLAREGLDLNYNQAEKLWKKFGEQRLDEIGRKTDTTRGKFEKLAKQIGINKDKADLWFDALKRLPKNTNLKISVDAKGFVKVNGVEISAGAYFSPHAAGGFISGGTPNRDSVPGMLMPGEVVVPTKMVQQGAVDHLRGTLPGFSRGGQVKGYAAGGKVGDTGDLRGDFPSRSFNAIKSFDLDSTIRTTVKATKAFAAYVKSLAAAGTGGSIVAYARSFLGKIPYRFGGTTLQGMDCSGFTGMVYRHAGYKGIPRTSEAQGMWAQKTDKPQTGGLAFYHSPAGGPDPGHVAIIDAGGKNVISQGGGMGPKIQRLRYMPLLWTGVPPGGFAQASLTGGKNSGSAQAWMHSHLADYGWGENQWGSLQGLWSGESGWRWNARNPSSGAYGIPQALPASKMASAGADWLTNPVTQMRWGSGYIKSVYGNPNSAYTKWLNRHPHWYGEGGAVSSYAAGGPVTRAERAGQTWLNAWRSRRGGGFGAAWGPIVLNEQIPRMQSAIGRATTLSHASGLSAGQHRFWANAATDEKKRLAVLKKELTTERTWRGELTGLDARLARQVGAAGNLKSLQPNVRRWKADIKANQYTTGQISKMLGYSDAYLKAHPAAPKVPPVKHIFGGDVGERISAFLASAASPFRNGGMIKKFDRGGWLQPGLTMAYNGTGRRERVSTGGDTTITLLVDTASGTAMDQMLAMMIKKYVKVHGGNVQTAYGAH